MNYKALRLYRLFHPLSKRAILLPIDHGITIGPTPGLRQVPDIIALAVRYRFQGIVAHKGTIAWALGSGEEACEANYVLHLSASTNLTPNVSSKQIVTSVEHGLRLGASGISLHVNVGVPDEYAMLKDLGRVCEEAAGWGLPVLAMFNVYEDSIGASAAFLRQKVGHAVRIAGELGADLVKIQYGGSYESMVEAVGAFPIPVLVAGGHKTDNVLDMLREIELTLSAGGRGVCIGRNVFEADYPDAVCQALNGIVHEGLCADEAFGLYSEQVFNQVRNGPPGRQEDRNRANEAETAAQNHAFRRRRASAAQTVDRLP